MIELKLDVDTLFEWQKHSQANSDVPHFEELLEFIDLRAQASETSCTAHKKQPRFDQHLKRPHGRVASFTTHSEPSDNNCVVCKTEKHPLYICTKFKSLSHDEVLKNNRLCTNCLASECFKRHCKSVQGLSETASHSPACTLRHKAMVLPNLVTNVDLKMPLKIEVNFFIIAIITFFFF